MVGNSKVKTSVFLEKFALSIIVLALGQNFNSMGIFSRFFHSIEQSKMSGLLA